MEPSVSTSPPAGSPLPEPEVDGKAKDIPQSPLPLYSTSIEYLLSPTTTCVSPHVTTGPNVPPMSQRASFSGPSPTTTTTTKRSGSLNLRPRAASPPNYNHELPETLFPANSANAIVSSPRAKRRDSTLNLAIHKHASPPLSSSSSSNSISSNQGPHTTNDQSSFQRHFARKLSFTPSEIRVLVVDRDEVHGQRVSEHLSRAGYPVELVSSGTQVITKLQGSAPPNGSPTLSLREQSTTTSSKTVHSEDTPLSNPFHLVLLDADLADDGNGFPETTKSAGAGKENVALALLKKIRASDEFKDVPVIVMTPSDATELAYACLRSGADDYILKPVRQDVIKGVWRSVWRKRKEKKVLQLLEDEQRRGKSLEARIGVLQDQVSIAVETPINLITRTIKGLCCDERLGGVAKNALSQVLISLKTSNLYRPAFEKLLLDDQLDPETRSWLSNEVIGNTITGASGPSKILSGNISPVVTLLSSTSTSASLSPASEEPVTPSVAKWIPQVHPPLTSRSQVVIPRRRRAASLGQLPFDYRGPGEIYALRKRSVTMETLGVETNTTSDTSAPQSTQDIDQCDCDSPLVSLAPLVIGGSKNRTSSTVREEEGMKINDKRAVAGENNSPTNVQVLRERVSIADSGVWVSASGRRSKVNFPFGGCAEDDEFDSGRRKLPLTTNMLQFPHEAVSPGHRPPFSPQQSDVRDGGDGTTRASLKISTPSPTNRSPRSRMPAATSISPTSTVLKEDAVEGEKLNVREWSRRSRSASSPVQFIPLSASSPQSAESNAKDSIHSPGGENGGEHDDLNSSAPREEAEVADRMNRMTWRLPTVEMGPFRLSAYTPFPMRDDGNREDTYAGSSGSNDSDSEIGSHHKPRGRRKNFKEKFEEDTSTDDMATVVEPNPAQRLSQIRSWNFDVWSFAHSELIGHLVELFNDAGLLRHYQIPLYTLTNFLKAVERGYGVNRNPYHNFNHAWDVTQAGYLFLKGSCIKDDNESVSPENDCLSTPSDVDSSSESDGPDSAWDSLDLSPFDQHPHLFTMNERFAFLVACLCHDLSHDGKSNNFHITTRSPLALLYNDRSILENFHAHQTFSVLAHNPECDIMAALPTASKVEIRSLIIRCILATDLARHVEVLARFNEAANAWSWEDGEKRASGLEMVMKCADVSNAMRPLHLAKGWADVLQEEMFAQGDLERKLHLPVSAFMDRTNPQQARLGLSFSDYMVAPLFRAVSTVLPKMSSHLPRLLNVRGYWHDMLEADAEKAEGKKSEEDFDQEADVCDDPEERKNGVELKNEGQEQDS